MAAGEHPNCQAIEDFLAAFKTVKRTISGTERIHGAPVSHGYTAAYWDNDRKIGFTVIAWGAGEFLVVVEQTGARPKRTDAKITDAAKLGSDVAALIEPQ